jgi:hypothetical protein
MDLQDSTDNVPEEENPLTTIEISLHPNDTILSVTYQLKSPSRSFTERTASASSAMLTRVSPRN